MTKRLFQLLLAIAALSVLGACGGGGAQSTSLALQPSENAPQAELASLPALPEDEVLNLYRMAAAASAVTNGSDFNTAAPSVVVAGDTAELASAPNAVSYALYRFGGVPGEQIDSIGYTVSGLTSGERVFMAIGNYTTGRWNFFPLQAQENVDVAITGNDYQSASGNTWIALATFGGDSVVVEQVRVEYADRYSVTGQIVDKSGAGIPDVLITSGLGGSTTRTDAAGNYSLSGLPNGTWPVAATLDGYTFYSQPTFVTVLDADAVVPQMVGDPHGARFEARETMPGNNEFGTQTPLWDFDADGPLTESVSADDDLLDIYRFVLDTPGQYILQYSNQDHNILMPLFAVLQYNSFAEIDAPTILSGDIGISLSVTNAPLELAFAVVGNAGGGEYTVDLIQADAAIYGISVSYGGVGYIGGGAIGTMTRMDNGHVTHYLFGTYLGSAPNEGYAMIDTAQLPGDITTSVEMSGHDIVPPVINSLLTLAAPVPASFTATKIVTGDSLEPNNSQGTAAVIPAIPYDNPTPLSVDASPGIDQFDYYKITPVAGAKVRAEIKFDTLANKVWPINAYIEDSGFQTRSHVWETPDGLVLELNEPASGSDYFIVVYSQYDANREIDYDLSIRNYSGGAIQFSTRVLPSTKIDGASFIVYDEQFEGRLRISNNERLDQLSKPIFKENGTELRVDCYRYGTDHDGQTQLVTATASDQVVYFDAADMGIDSLEPNTYTALPLVEQALPATINASLEVLTDLQDVYRLSPGDGQPFRVALTTDSPDSILIFSILDNVGTPQATVTLRGDSGVIYLPNDGTFGQKLAVQIGNLTTARYTIEISTGEAYKISGLMETAGSVDISGFVFNKTTGDQVSGFGDYDFGRLYPPGSYELEAMAPGYTPTLPSVNVNVVNADVVVDFAIFVAAAADPYEPNNDRMTAQTVILGADYLAWSGGGTYDVDFYELMLSVGETVRVTVTPEAIDWQNGHQTVARGDSFSQEMTAAFRAPTGEYFFDYKAQTSTPVYIRVGGQGDYTLRADLIP